MTPLIAIVDYGMGNLHSVEKALQRLGFRSLITSDPDQVLRAAAVILPGVGAYADAMSALRRQGLDGALRRTAALGRPLLGICLGLQLLFDFSEENGGVEGLGILPGRVQRLPEGAGLKVPHMGWNRLDITRSTALLRDLPPQPHVYFVHSYHVVPDDPRVTIATAPYGLDLVAAASRENCHGVQFHPEKSAEAGLRILSNFARLAAGSKEQSA
ncbi:MAG: imidazole glycerol phosphate synthase subunit HisH [Bacillota bacterium]